MKKNIFKITCKFKVKIQIQILLNARTAYVNFIKTTNNKTFDIYSRVFYRIDMQ